jgi:PAS domain S-box-containing protein
MKDSIDVYRLLVEQVNDYAIFMLDTGGHVATWNPGAERLKGWKADEIIGRHFSAFYQRHEVEAGKCERELEVAAKVGRVEDEGWRVRKDGSLIWANVVITALRDESGTLRGFGKVTRDLSERRRADEELRQSEERLRLLLEQVKDYAIFMLDPEGRVISWNQGAERLKGYLREEILGEHFSRFYSDADRKEGKPARELALATRDGRVEAEGWRVRKDGSRFLANVVITALRGADGELRGYAKVTRDVTERFTSAERALVKSETRFQTLADNIAQLAWMADAAGFTFWYNKRWFDYTGQTLEQMQRSGWDAVHHPDHHDRVRDKWRQALSDGRSFEDTYPLRRFDGTYRWFLSRALPVRGERGDVLLWFGTSTDVTGQRELQQALEAAVHARDVFLSIASHELKTPLTPLALQLQSIQRLGAKAAGGVLPVDKVLEKVGKAGLQVAHLERLVDNLLDVSRLAENRLNLSLELLDLSKTVLEVVDRQRPQAELAQSELAVRAQPGVTGRWDRFRLDQIVSNLLGNALKYGAGKPIEVEVAGQDGEASIVVRDHGIGISRADQERIFDRFERAVSENNYGGFGLGLWITRQLVDAMKGKITVESEPGRGSTFKVSLPRG